MAMTKEGTASGPLRWRVGETVECWWRSNPDGPGCWLRGVVVGHWWRNENWPDGQAAPYQVRLDDGTLIFAPRDDDSCVREAAPDLDLDPDAPEPPELPSGSAARPQGPPPPQPQGIPWRQVKTKDGKTYYYHPVTKETAWEDPDQQPQQRARQPQEAAHDAAQLAEPGKPKASLPEAVRQAAEEGKKQTIDEYLGANPGAVNAADAQGRTLLMTASFGGRGSEEIVRMLITQRAAPDLRDGHGCTALMYACVKGRDQVAAMLLSAGADAGVRDARGGSALHLATMLGHPPLVQRLLLAGADERQVHAAVSMHALKLAETAGHAEILALFRRPAEERGKPLQLGGEVGLHGLRWMASDRALALAQELGPLVLKMAGHARSVTLAQAARAAPKLLPELLRPAAEVGNVMLWVSQGGSPDACDEDGVTLLMRQVNAGRAGVAERLLQLRASPDAVDKRGRTALMGAASGGRDEEVSLLLQHRASVNMVDASGYTALLRASCMGRAECVRRLLSAGAKRELKDPSGRTALHVAEQLGHHAVAVQLRGAARDGAAAAAPGKPPATSPDGRSPSTKERVAARAAAQAQAQAQPGGAPPEPRELSPAARRGKEGRPRTTHGELPVPPGTAASAMLGGGGRAVEPTKLPAELYTLACGGEVQAPNTFAEALRSWAARGGSLDAHGPQHGWTMLMGACAAGREAEAAALLDAKAAPDAVSAAPRLGVTALSAASTEGHAALVALLLARGAAPDPPALVQAKAAPNIAFSALQAAASAGHLACVRRLLHAGAKTTLQHPRTGMTPLRAAEAHGQLAVALTLKMAAKRTPTAAADDTQPAPKRPAASAVSDAKPQEAEAAPPAAAPPAPPAPEEHTAPHGASTARIKKGAKKK